MRITLNENEIKEALVRYVAGQGVDVSGRNVEVSMTAGRGANGYTADIDITDAKPVLERVYAASVDKGNTEPGITETGVAAQTSSDTETTDTGSVGTQTKSIFDQ